MCAMCHSRGSEIMKMENDEKVTGNDSLLKLENGGGGNCISCKDCGEAQSSTSTPMISPTISLSSCDSTVSSSSEFSVDMNSYCRNNQETSLFSGYEGPNFLSVNSQLEINSTYSGHEDSNRSPDVNSQHHGKHDSVSEEVENSHYFDNDMEALIWDPPEQEDLENNLEGYLNFDDDEGCGNAASWGKPSSPSTLTDEGSGSFRFKEKQRALEEVVNGKFRALVGQLLRSIGIYSSADDKENWVDILTSLSWEAATFLRPDAVDGKGLDAHVKVKCIANGSRSQSQVFKGLVFKKHVAHKRMLTEYKNPKLLLIRGVLGESSNGLSSFVTMEEEGDRLKSVIKMIEACHPNVILVEKSVSRDVQESLLQKGMTLVFDMKLNRLERIALCTGSSIVSTETFAVHKLKQCDSFCVKKFIEEHADLSEGGKKLSKTLMFLEGCPSHLGCTILLRGGPSDELKKVKSILLCMVLMAYHLFLETSFLVDQKSMFSALSFPETCNSFQNSLQSPMQTSSDQASPVAFEEESSTTDIPISNDLHDEVSDYSNLESPSAYPPYNPIIFSGFSSLSASLMKVIVDNFPLASTYPSLSSYFGMNQSGHNGQVIDTANTEEVVTSEIEISDDNSESNLEAVAPAGVVDTAGQNDHYSEEETGSKDEVNPVMLDNQSILVLMSRMNAMRGTVCEQSHFSRIAFYQNWDIPLGKFLQENILNQKSKCSTCGELPEAHFYYYAHYNKQLRIKVKRLPESKVLAGDEEGKIWMWGCCGKCASGNGTKRVLISTAARALSFGKFLELSFSHYSSPSILLSCGHSLQRDFLYFFGLGPMAAMFRYSPVTTFTVSMPPQMLDFNSGIETKRIMGEIEKVQLKATSLFSEVRNSLDKIKLKFEGFTPYPGMEFLDIEEMLKDEHNEFELSLQNTTRNGDLGEGVHKVLNLNLLLWELLLESIIWDRRINSLLCSDVISASLPMVSAEEQSNLQREIEVSSSNVGFSNKDESIEDHVQEDGALSTHEVPIESQVGEESDDSSSLSVVANIKNQEVVPDQVPSLDVHRMESSINPVKPFTSQSSLLSTRKGSSEWFWRSFPEIREAYFSKISPNFFSKIEPTNGTTSELLPFARHLILEEGCRLHIPLESGKGKTYLLSDYEGEISSIIACALALLKQQPLEHEHGNFRVEMQNLIHTPPTNTTHLSSKGLLGPDLVNSSILDETNLLCFDGLFMSLHVASLDSLLASGELKAEVCLGVTRSMTKGKYSVVCPYADQFQDLRSRCCPSEVDFIASLSRCKNWDAKGGKSKSVFAKTLDDRFIIKEIKKTEFESFEKFAPLYFKHMLESFQIGNQTCLAKVLGIYQVTIRQPKSGKEIRHDLMVMENLTYGRNITRQYDLKGALHARYNSGGSGTGDVLLDQNFVNDMNFSPLYISSKTKHFLQRAVWNDTGFLNGINVMDYSLLVGVDTEERELVCGIIDYLRQYTWDKQLETWVKASLYVPKNTLPTVISPKEYKKRFRKFMSTNFLSVPDNWCSESCDEPAADDVSSTLISPRIKEA
ncbi:hypothetical protein SAY86_020072 [Trapa natans]|uniref:1-phosphatidylinositol-3-phosphate 5-kinase n=1 Tax=Trapa natans TaxID=22666 RepID=A0AAN7LYU1_TRANT|nr:hypothetical protein SAY86_020072 [Trapa natans]